MYAHRLDGIGLAPFAPIAPCASSTSLASPTSHGRIRLPLCPESRALCRSYAFRPTLRATPPAYPGPRGPAARSATLGVPSRVRPGPLPHGRHLSKPPRRDRRRGCLGDPAAVSNRHAGTQDARGLARHARDSRPDSRLCQPIRTGAPPPTTDRPHPELRGFGATGHRGIGHRSAPCAQPAPACAPSHRVIPYATGRQRGRWKPRNARPVRTADLTAGAVFSPAKPRPLSPKRPPHAMVPWQDAVVQTHDAPNTRAVVRSEAFGGGDAVVAPTGMYLRHFPGQAGRSHRVRRRGSGRVARCRAQNSAAPTGRTNEIGTLLTSSRSKVTSSHASSVARSLRNRILLSSWPDL